MKKQARMGRSFGSSITMQEARIAWLLKHKTGDAVGALYHPDPRLGDVDLFLGKPGTREKDYEDGEGIAKLEAKGRLGLLDALPDFFPLMKVDEKRSGQNRIRLFDYRHKAAVRLDYDGKAKKWLLTVYEDNKPLASGRRTSVPGTPANESGETPSPDRGLSQSRSAGKTSFTASTPGEERDEAHSPERGPDSSFPGETPSVKGETSQPRCSRAPYRGMKRERKGRARSHLSQFRHEYDNPPASERNP